MSIIPGIDTGAPERTLTSSGSAGSPKRRPSEGLDAAHPLAQLVVEAGRPAVREEPTAGLGRDDEGRRDGQAQVAGHHAEVRGLAAEEGSRIGLGQAERLVERVGEGHGVTARSPRHRAARARRAPGSAAGRG